MPQPGGGVDCSSPPIYLPFLIDSRDLRGAVRVAPSDLCPLVIRDVHFGVTRQEGQE